MREALAAVRRVVAAGSPKIGWGLLAAVTLALAAAVTALPPIFTGKIIDALQHGDPNATFRSLGIFVLVTLLAALLSFGNSMSTSVFREGIARELRMTLMRKLLTARLCALEQLSFGEVSNRLNDDLDNLSTKFEYLVFPAISSACTLVATIVAMIAVDARFAALAVAAVLFSLLPSRLVAPHVAKTQRDDARAQDVRATAVSEYAALGALMLLRHPRASARQVEAYAALADATRAIRLRSAALFGVSNLAATTTNLIGPAVILALGSYLLLHHATTVGTIVVFLMYQGRLYAPFTSMSNIPLQLTNCAVFARRILQILEMEDESAGSEPLRDGDLEFDVVTVRKHDRAVLKTVSFSIGFGEHVAIVGPSGAGKSTIGSLLVRLYEPDGGAIRVAKNDVREHSLEALRESIVVVSQEPLVFDMTLRENLTYLRPDADDARVTAAVRTCHLDDVLVRLQDGYDTELGQRGFRLSGGERQRVCVARALIGDPRMLVLDEALTGVDLETEAAIMRDLRAAYAQRTLIVITHRLRSIAQFGRVIVLEDGVVTARETHEQARLNSDWYAEATVSFANAVAPL